VAWISLLAATDPFNVIRFAGRYFSGIIVIVSLPLLLTAQSRFKALQAGLMVGLISTLVMALLAFIAGIPGWAIGVGGQARGLYMHPNQLAIALTTMAPWVFARLVLMPRNYLNILPAIAIPVVIFLTGSRANMVLVVLVILIFTIYSGIRRWNATAPIRALTAILAATGVVFICWQALTYWLPSGARQIQQVSGAKPTEMGLDTRLLIWDRVIEETSDNILIGQGATHATEQLASGHAHNMAIEFYGGMGLLGLGALILLVASVTLVTFRLFSASTKFSGDSRELSAASVGVAIGLLSHLGANISSSSLGSSTIPMFWLFLGIGLALLGPLSFEARSKRLSHPGVSGNNRFQSH
jgi:O-antigen ligase